MDISCVSPISCLPPELKEEVFLNLSLNSVKLAKLVCREWRAIIVDETFWKRFTCDVNEMSLAEIKQLAFTCLLGRDAARNERFGFFLAERFAEEISKRELMSPTSRLLFSLAEIQAGGLSSVKQFDAIFDNILWLKTMAEEDCPFGLYARALSSNKYFGLTLESFIASQSSDGKQKKNAINDLQKASQKGFAAAQYVLSMLDKSQISLLRENRSPEAAFYDYLLSDRFSVCIENLKRSATGGHHWSQYAMVFHTETKEGLEWAVRAAMQGNILAQFYVGQEKRYALREVSLNEAERRWVEQTIAAGEGACYFYLGDLCLSNDEEMTEEEREAFESIREGSIFEQWLEIPYLFAMLYSSGSIIKKNETKSLEYFYQVKARSEMLASKLQKVFEFCT